ncbi:MAG: precorrin-3B synthase, partial [Microcystis sp.]
ITVNNPTNLTSIVCFRLALAGDKQLYDTDLLIEPENCLAVVKALVTVYLDYVQQTPNIKGKKPRMKHLLKDWGLTKYLEQVNSQLHRTSTGIIQPQEYWQAAHSTQPYFHLGIHPQKQPGLSYIGLSL